MVNTIDADASHASRSNSHTNLNSRYLSGTHALADNVTLNGIYIARFFCDGLEMTEGDSIVIGTDPAVTITDINYTTNTITLKDLVLGLIMLPFAWRTAVRRRILAHLNIEKAFLPAIFKLRVDNKQKLS